jgi:hypothetical protein
MNCFEALPCFIVHRDLVGIILHIEEFFGELYHPFIVTFGHSVRSGNIDVVSANWKSGF